MIMERNWVVKPPCRPHFDLDLCLFGEGCAECAKQCSWGEIRLEPVRVGEEIKHRPVANWKACGACYRCVKYCPAGAIHIEQVPMEPTHRYWTSVFTTRVWRQAGDTGGVLLTGSGADGPQTRYFDHLMFDACQVTNPSIDPLREPMETRVWMGRRPLSVREVGSHPLLQLEIPILFAAMSFGALNLRVQQAAARASRQVGTFWNTGEGGVHEDLKGYAENTIVQVASGRYGVDAAYLSGAAAIEIKIGQGAKPGIGGHLPGEKVTSSVGETRRIPSGTDALSPAPHHDIYSIEDLRQLIFALKETMDYKLPVGVKIAAVHNVAPIVSGITQAGADFITIDGFRGGTGATPLVIRQGTGISVELAIAAADQRLCDEGIREQVSLIASGGIQSAADVLKLICLGADACYVGTAMLVALGCGMCQKCFAGKCAYGITTNRPDLLERVDVEESTEALVNFLHAWREEIRELMGSMGISTIEALRGNRDRLRGIGLTEKELSVLGIKHAGE